MIDFAREHKRCAIWAGCGTGKTSAMEYYLALDRLLGGISEDPTLVLGPMRVARDQHQLFRSVGCGQLPHFITDGRTRRRCGNQSVMVPRPGGREARLVAFKKHGGNLRSLASRAKHAARDPSR